MTDPHSELRGDLAGLAAADPLTLANVLVATMRQHPECEATLRGYLRSALPTRADAAPDPAPDAASDRAAARLRARYHVRGARVDVVHRPVATSGRVVDLSVRAGEDAIVLGGNVVALRAVAAHVAAAGGDGDATVEALCGDILAQLSGALSQRSLSRRPAPRLLAPAPPPAEADDEAMRCLHAIAASWPPAAMLRRERGEASAAYVRRIVVALRAAATAGHADAEAALAVVRSDFPGWLDPDV